MMYARVLRTGRFWDLSLASPCLVVVPDDSEEFHFVKDRFHVHGFSKPIVTVQRVQNLEQWERYFNRRQQVEKDMHKKAAPRRGDAGPGNELWMLHGTRETDPEVIWRDDAGFDFRFSAAGMY